MSPSPIPPELINKRIGQLRDDVDSTEDQLSKLRAELAWYEEAKQLFGDAPPDPDVEPPLPGITEERETPSTNGAKPTLRQAILKVMSDDARKTWKVETVIAELRERGWMPGGEHAEHRTRSVLAQMNRKGEIKRMDRGRYRLPKGQQ